MTEQVNVVTYLRLNFLSKLKFDQHIHTMTVTYSIYVVRH
jgi:hypothetical protein